MKGLQKGICFLLLLTGVLAQSAIAQQTSEVSDPWLDRAQSLAAKLVKDADVLGRYDRVLLWARLSRMWQQRDAARAQAWLEQAVQAVEAAPDKEDVTERNQRLNAARSLLVMLGAQNKALRARLNKVLNAASEEATPSDKGENAKAKAEAGLAVVDSDPHRALQFGLASLRTGGSYKLASLLWRLRKRDVSLSDTLFMAIIAAARVDNYNPNLLTLLPVTAFDSVPPSDKLRVSFLQALAEGLLRVPSSAQEQASICQLASLAAPLLLEFQRLLPPQASAVRTQLVVCQPSLDPEVRQAVNDALADKTLKTVDDFLEAANKTADRVQRVTYLERAAYMSFNEAKYDRAVAILDGMNSADHEWMNKTPRGLWDNWRITFASSAAIAHLKQGDRLMMDQIIAATPLLLRAAVQISVAAELAKKDGPAATQLLDEARAALAKTAATQDFDAYLSLVHLYVTLNPTDTLPTLLDAVKAMNRLEQAPQAGDDMNDVEASIPLLSNDMLLARYALPASLLTIDDIGAQQIIASVASPTRRAAMRLALLGAALRQSRSVPIKPPVQMKGQNNAHQ